ncbi:Pex19 protein family-domain-containing protein [Boeremia exigua]|uniref:Pex19 protein family-domain-containing protein n=1 Tax=Boeremia exigua TaxID=749465 RepID=UPI001E8DC5BF|nr:Pex19 protein family-domain-containing protein [Boeremia exigua]KAH6639689.1 Pex19 protein family-domain-containing protein [Boeremia exigua]
MADAPVKQEKEHVKAAPPPADVASDPEEDDLSDLDDVLDEFANTKLDSKSPAPVSKAAPPPSAPSTSGPGRPEDVSPAELLLQDEDEFAKKLQEEMAQLLGQGDFQKQFEDIMKEMNSEMGGDHLPAPTAAEAAATASSSLKDSIPSKSSESTSKADKNFQDTIRKTMERMQESGDAASSAAASSANQDDILAQMLKEMESGGFGGEGNDEDFSKILMGMMEQLTNKEILYEPMKELDDKFPAWMEKNKDKVPAEDLKRYEEQQVLVKEITGRFERKGYSDDNAKDREYIVERMQKMQAAGSPPPDLVGDMNAAQEALAGMDEGCPTQ